MVAYRGNYYSKQGEFMGEGKPLRPLPISWVDETKPPPPIVDKVSVCDPLCKAINLLPAEHVLKSELTLEQEIRERDGFFDRTYGLLKILLWDEYHRSLDLDDYMRIENVWGTVVPAKWWERRVVKDPLVLSWMITPPVDEILLKKEMIIRGMNKLREVIEAPLYKTVSRKETDEDGKTVYVKDKQVDLALAKEIHSIVKTLQDRVHGAITQRHEIDQRSMSLNLSANASSDDTMRHLGSSVSMDELDKYAEKLRNIQLSIEGITEKDE